MVILDISKYVGSRQKLDTYLTTMVDIGGSATFLFHKRHFFHPRFALLMDFLFHRDMLLGFGVMLISFGNSCLAKILSKPENSEF